uniref:Uncharacterized protein n=1 Tax=Oryza glumipatula TaxID=40148 RepID=A0A0E0A869_9ORYZ
MGERRPTSLAELRHLERLRRRDREDGGDGRGADREGMHEEPRIGRRGAGLEDNTEDERVRGREQRRRGTETGEERHHAGEVGHGGMAGGDGGVGNLVLRHSQIWWRPRQAANGAGESGASQRGGDGRSRPAKLASRRFAPPLPAAAPPATETRRSIGATPDAQPRRHPPARPGSSASSSGKSLRRTKATPTPHANGSKVAARLTRLLRRSGALARLRNSKVIARSLRSAAVAVAMLVPTSSPAHMLPPSVAATAGDGAGVPHFVGTAR